MKRWIERMARYFMVITVGWVLLNALVMWWGVCSVLRGSWLCPWGLGQ